MTNIMTLYKTILLILPILILSACSTNQATGRNQFTGLMPASQEAQIGAQEHQKILDQFGGAVKDKALRDYVTRIGQKIVPHTERKDVKYTFTLLDSPVVNAFALPGGYVYVTRGILTLANNEADLAGVMAHEIGHVTARHSAERYSTSVLTSIGASLLSAAIKVDGASQALGLGANLYLSSYSRSQEHESDDLGIRYLARAGYDTMGMANFLKSLEASSALEKKEAGKDTKNVPNYLSTHPVTADRIAKSIAEANKYPSDNHETHRVTYLKMINSMTVGDSAEQGFIDNNKFVHPELGFMFNTPTGFKIHNTSQAVIAKSKVKNGPTLIFSSGKKDISQSAKDILTQVVLKGDTSTARDLGTNTVNGFKIASAETSGVVGGLKSNVRHIVIEWDKDSVYFFSLVMPEHTASVEIEKLKDSAFSFKRMNASDKLKYRPKRIQVRVAKSGATSATMSKKFPYDDDLNTMRFNVINGLKTGQALQQGRAYKVISQ
jgi:predicted Zn-dependent protease